MPVLERFEAKKQLRSKIFNLITLGYKDRERIREADKLVRVTIAHGFKGVQVKIGYCTDLLSKSLKTGALAELQKISKQCDRISVQTEHAEQGYAPHFTLTPIKKEQLKDFYDFDMKLLDDLTALDSEAAKLVSVIESGGDAGISPKINDLKKKLNGVELKLKRREDIVLKIASD